MLEIKRHKQDYRILVARLSMLIQGYPDFNPKISSRSEWLNRFYIPSITSCKNCMELSGIIIHMDEYYDYDHDFATAKSTFNMSMFCDGLRSKSRSLTAKSQNSCLKIYFQTYTDKYINNKSSKYSHHNKSPFYEHENCHCYFDIVNQIYAGTATINIYEGADYYIIHNKTLPDYYITKSTALESGWRKYKANYTKLHQAK